MTTYGITIFENEVVSVGLEHFGKDWSTSADCCDANLPPKTERFIIQFKRINSQMLLCPECFVALFGKHPAVRNFAVKLLTNKKILAIAVD